MNTDRRRREGAARRLKGGLSRFTTGTFTYFGALTFITSYFSLLDGLRVARLARDTMIR